MASKQLVIVFAIIAVVLPTVVTATEYIVGDDKGWTTKFDYQAWAKDKVFVVGDKLVFKYTVGIHNVFKVNGTGFKDCIVPPENNALATGNDIINLATPGKKWYICGKEQHCTDGGQKLTINVQSQFPPAPSPAPPLENSATGISVLGYHVLIAAMLSLMVMF